MRCSRIARSPRTSRSGCACAGWTRRDRARVAAALRQVALEGYEDRRPAQLSGGQQQRVALARAIVIRPRVLLCDEPLAALDRKLRQSMQFELKQLQQQLGVTTGLRHARPGRGDDDVGPHRRDERGQGSSRSARPPRSTTVRARASSPTSSARSRMAKRLVHRPREAASCPSRPGFGQGIDCGSAGTHQP
jgi:hypothetical protein